MEQLLVCVVADSNMLARRGDPVWKNGWPSWAVIQTPFPQVETHGSQPVPLRDRVRSSSGTGLFIFAAVFFDDKSFKALGYGKSPCREALGRIVICGCL